MVFSSGWFKAAVALLHASTAIAAPLPLGAKSSESTEKRQVSGLNLRIMPLGDSITVGYPGDPSNGYRGPLYNLLVSDNTVDMVGENQDGDMSDPDNQGNSGYTISEIDDNATDALPSRPNVVLLHAGTNDIGRPEDPAGAPERLSSLIDKIFAACEDATIVVAQIIRNKDSADTNGQIETYNSAISTNVDARVANGQHVVSVNMYDILLDEDFADGIHPSDSGYAKMATVWLQGIQTASDNDWIKDPVSTG